MENSVYCFVYTHNTYNITPIFVFLKQFLFIWLDNSINDYYFAPTSIDSFEERIFWWWWWLNYVILCFLFFLLSFYYLYGSRPSFFQENKFKNVRPYIRVSAIQSICPSVCPTVSAGFLFFIINIFFVLSNNKLLNDMQCWGVVTYIVGLLWFGIGRLGCTWELCSHCWLFLLLEVYKILWLGNRKLFFVFFTNNLTDCLQACGQTFYWFILVFCF